MRDLEKIEVVGLKLSNIDLLRFFKDMAKCLKKCNEAIKKAGIKNDKH